MVIATRPTPEQFAAADWAAILPLYDALASRPLNTGDADAWLADWSALDEAVEEAQERASVAYTIDTLDPAKEAIHLRFSGEIAPRMHEQRVRLAMRLLELGYTRDDLTTLLRRFRNQVELFREANVPLNAELQKLNARYQKITGAFMVDWDGVEKTIPQLAPYLLSHDRAVRERALRTMAEPYVERRDELADIFDRQYALRQEVARNAGFAHYRDFAHRENDRFDYTPDDCERFHAAVEETVVPAAERLLARRRRQMGLDTLRPWDLQPDPLGRPPLKPFDEVGTLIDRGTTIFARVDPTLGGYFKMMADEGLLDLDSRKGKAPGGYCTGFPYSKRPFIFMNAVGVANDVDTLLHEAGHAFHEFEADRLPLLWQRFPGAEMAEVGSMAMELLAAPFLAAEDGGYYSAEDARRARIEHLQSIILMFPHIAAVDAFQHWIYTSGEGHDRDARDAAWLRIQDRFMRGVDWSGLTAERLARWYRQLHIFLFPFYYIEYGIAQLGALQVWRNSLRDPSSAVTAYRHALALGATVPLPQLFEAAGARFAFDTATFGELVALVEEQLGVMGDG
jgi:oligoendopeptidase F